MANKSTRRQPRRPSAPRTGGAPAKRGAEPRRPSTPAPAAAAVAANAANVPFRTEHVGRDLRRIFVISALMFAIVIGARVMANTYGTNFVLDLVR